MSTKNVVEVLKKWRETFSAVVPFRPGMDSLLLFDFTSKNTSLTADQIADTEQFANYINKQLKDNHATFGIGGYKEDRTLYARSRHFDAGEEPRRLHLGTDIWGPAGTKVMAPMEGIVHSFAFNNHDSDYGATIILSHRLDGISFHTLYGHLSLNSIKNLQEGNRIRAEEVFGSLVCVLKMVTGRPIFIFRL